MRCTHEPKCPKAHDSNALAAVVVADHWEQGWALLCNGILVFDDGGSLVPSQRNLTPPPARVA